MGNQKRKLTDIRKDTRLLTQALRYGAAAFLGFAADYAVLLMLKEWLGLHYLLAVPIAFLVGVGVNYLVGVLFVFCRGNWSRGLELSLFLLISLLALAVTELSMYLLTDALGIDYRISRIVAGVVTYLFNFFSRRWLLYCRKEDKQNPCGG
ncbi:MAG TPA: GtrA family protein [Eubacteriales bacterium]|nr:GtrA family protein [Eubacteriales bacterium]